MQDKSVREQQFDSGSQSPGQPPDRSLDILIVGAGLAGGLLAYRLKTTRPEISFRVVEANSELIDDHTWCFHESDLQPSALAWIKPLISKSWSSHVVRFPNETYQPQAGVYHAIRSSDFNSKLKTKLSGNLSVGTPVKKISPQSIELSDGTKIHAGVVIDTTGIPRHENLHCGWQKFVGLDLKLKSPHGLKNPVLMDATVEQIDGFRFLYALPWDERTLLLEDTVYSDNADIDLKEFEDRIRAYAKLKRWEIDSVERRECGALPIPISRLPQGGQRGEDAPALGMAAGFFHMTTGYSLPDSVRTIDLLLSLPELNLESVRQSLRQYRASWEPRQNFYRLLNRMLFQAAAPESRYKVLARFYRLGEALVTRFYAGQTTLLDRARLLAGKPPVPVARAFSCWLQHSRGGA